MEKILSYLTAPSIEEVATLIKNNKDSIKADESVVDKYGSMRVHKRIFNQRLAKCRTNDQLIYWLGFRLSLINRISRLSVRNSETIEQIQNYFIAKTAERLR